MAKTAAKKGARRAPAPGAKRRADTTVKTGDSVSPVATLVPQPHGGALRNGGPNSGGPGRPKSEIRAAALAGAEEAIPVLRAIARDEQAKRSDRVAAGGVLLKYGLGMQREVSVDEVQDRLRQTVGMLREVLPPEMAVDVLVRLRAIWV